MARVVSMATRIKISRSLKGNRNAFRGGPKRKLTAREKVANINAATAKKRKVLSQAQLENRKKAAMRLRRQARAEEAGIKPNASNTKPLPTATSVKKDPDIKEATARAKGSIPQAPNHRNFGPSGFREEQDKLAARYLDMHGDNGLNRKVQQLEKRKRLSVKEQGELGALQRLNDSRRAAREEGVPAKVTGVSEPRAATYTSKQAHLMKEATIRTGDFSVGNKISDPGTGKSGIIAGKRSAGRTTYVQLVGGGEIRMTGGKKVFVISAKSAQAKGRKVR